MRLSVNQTLAIMMGGALGALLRYLISNAIYDWLGRSFPWGTLGVNVFGSFLMGLLSLLLLERWQIDPAIKLMILVGFLGAFTTFSTFSMETFHLLQQGHPLKAVINSLLSVVFCVFAVWLGILVGQQWIK